MGKLGEQRELSEPRLQRGGLPRWAEIAYRFLPRGHLSVWTQTKNGASPRSIISHEPKNKQWRLDSRRGGRDVLVPCGAFGTWAECWGDLKAGTSLRRQSEASSWFFLKKFATCWCCVGEEAKRDKLRGIEIISPKDSGDKMESLKKNRRLTQEKVGKERSRAKR